MDELLVTVEDVKNELGIDLRTELGKQPQYVNRWLARVQRTIINHVARYAYNGMRQAERMLKNVDCAKMIKEAILEQIDYLATNNFVQADKVMNVSGQIAGPGVAPLAHQILLNAGLLYSGAGF